MTDKEKAKAYDEALDRAKEFHKSKEGIYVLAAETIFPELRESEDERMVRKIESFLSAYGSDYFSNDEWREIEVWLEKQKGQKPAEWSEEDEENFKWFDKFFRAESIMLDGRDIPQDKYLWFKSLHPQPKEELAKMLQDEYNKGKETGERDGHTKGYNKGYKDANESVSYHFPVMPTTPVFGCDGIHCTNPQMDCINCPRKTTGGMFSTASSSGDPTLKAEWKPSEEQEEPEYYQHFDPDC